jgi:hypothetical protein
MPRNNDKPFPCCDCRFNHDWSCMRNPPTPIDRGVSYPTASWFPEVNGKCGCFAGEPIMQRSCDTCRMKTCCGIWRNLLGSDGGFDLNGWYCSDWKGRE